MKTMRTFKTIEASKIRNGEFKNKDVKKFYVKETFKALKKF